MGRGTTLEGLAKIAATVQVQGDIVECGVFAGDSLAVLAKALPNRQLWAYDSFQGLPEPNAKYDPERAWKQVGDCQANVSEVYNKLRGQNLTVRPGWFEDTFFEEPFPRKIAFLHIDCDWYDSILMSLRIMEPLVAIGGIVALDDWQAWEGCQKAYMDWVVDQPMQVIPTIQRYGSGEAYWTKS